MLQEIINKITEPGRTAVRRIQGLLFDATIGLAREYQRKTLDLARITAATFYLRAVKGARKAAIVIFLVTLASVVFAVALVVIPVVLVLISPWTLGQKMTAVALLGILDIAAASFYLINLLSEENWMKVTKSQEFVDEIMKS